MSYAEITFKDKNPIKRWIHRQRLLSAIKLCRRLSQPIGAICDFGAGNGELCKLAAASYPEARIICYEPAPSLLAEARANLSNVSNVELCQDIGTVSPGTLDVVFCLEVFEHLPPEETTDALRTIFGLLKPEGTAVVGVPVEVGFPALYKGIFRMARRYGAFDANLRNVASSSFGFPPENRPISELAPGIRWHFEHTGFDFRPFGKILGGYFTLRKVSASPFPALGSLLMPEVYFVAEKTTEAPTHRGLSSR